MLAHRIIPTLLTRGRELVKGVGFDSWRSVGVVAQAVRIHQARAVDELVLLDIKATVDGRKPDLELVSELAGECFSPLTVGGGIDSVADVKALLRAGADKVVVCSAALERPRLITEIANEAGAQAIVVAVDVKDGAVWGRQGTIVGKDDPVAWAQEAQALGAGEILLTSIERDGRMCGYDLSLIRQVATAVSIPVVAAGGCGDYSHMLEAIEAGADAVASGAMFQFMDATPKEAARFLKDNGVEVRL